MLNKILCVYTAPEMLNSEIEILLLLYLFSLFSARCKPIYIYRLGPCTKKCSNKLF